MNNIISKSSPADDNVYMSISFNSIDKQKAMQIRNLIMRECGTDSVTIYFDKPINIDEEDDNAGD